MSSARFKIEGVVKYKPKGIGLKVETVEKTSTKTYTTTHECICFKGEADGLEEGDQVTVTGDLGAKKSEYVRTYNGKDYPVWLTKLIVREVVKGGEFKPKAAPKPAPAKHAAAFDPDDNLAF